MSHNLKIAGLAFALLAGAGYAGTACADDQAPMGHMGADQGHLTSAPTSSDHMSSGDAMSSGHMAGGAMHTSKTKKPANPPNAMSSDGMSNSQH